MKIKSVYFFVFFIQILSIRAHSADWTKTANLPHQKNLNPIYEQVVVDDQGNATALLIEERSDLSLPKARLSIDTLKFGETKWQTTNNFADYPNQFSRPPASDLEGPPAQIAISKEGRVAVIWATTPSKQLKTVLIKSSILEPGSQILDVPKTITTYSDNMMGSGTPVITFDQNSRLHAVWADHSNGQRNIKSAYLDPQSTEWSTPILVSNSFVNQNFDSTNPIITTDFHQNRVVAIWKEVNTEKNSLYGAYLTLATNKWSKPVLLSNPDIFIKLNYYVSQKNKANKNYAVVSWLEIDPQDNKKTTIKYATLDHSGQWTPNLFVGNTQDTFNLSMDMDQKQNAILVYDSNKRIYAITISPDAKPTTPIQISNDASSRLAKVVVNAEGKSIAIWRQDLSNSMLAIFSSDKLQGKKWTTPIKISANTLKNRNILNTNLADNSIGTTLAIWNENSLNSGRVNASILLVVAPPPCIKGIQGKNIFLLQKNSYNTITWCQSPSKGVVKYNVYRNNALIGVVKASDSLSFTDQDIKRGITYRYSIRAVTKAGNISQARHISLP